MDWLKELNQSLPAFLAALQVDGQAGRYLPCLRGTTRLGRQASLGFSCFALKLAKILGSWETLPASSRGAWIEHIQGYQVTGKPLRSTFSENAFIDPAIIRSFPQTLDLEQLLYQGYTILKNPRQSLAQLVTKQGLSSQERALIAETKQALATLDEVHVQARGIFSGFPQTPQTIHDHLQRLDWSQPWGAGGQAAALPVFIATQAPRFLPEQAVQALKQSCMDFFEAIADPGTGAFFKGRTPHYGNLVNGAMKVLTAMDWLAQPIPYTQQLIETVISQLPQPDGCHLVDSIYVLYRCLQQTDHHREKVRDYCTRVLEMISGHRNPDGGFSYYIQRSQTGYYGVRIARGLPESDLHGTILLTWAIAMILEMIETNPFGWRVIKP